MDLDPLDEKLDDTRLLPGEQLLPHRVEPFQGVDDLLLRGRVMLEGADVRLRPTVSGPRDRHGNARQALTRSDRKRTVPVVRGDLHDHDRLEGLG